MKAGSFIRGAIILSALYVSSAHAGTAGSGSVPGWEARLNIAQGSAGINVYLGQRPDATDGIDGYYDVPAFSSEGFNAHLALEGGRYWRDIRHYGQISSVVWRLELEPSGGRPVVIRWKPADIPDNVTALLVDPASGSVIDMKDNSEFAVQPDMAHELRIEAVTH